MIETRDAVSALAATVSGVARGSAYDTISDLSRLKGCSKHVLLRRIFRGFAARRPWERGLPFQEPDRRTRGGARGRMRSAPGAGDKGAHGIWLQTAFYTTEAEHAAINELAASLTDQDGEKLSVLTLVNTSILWWIWVVEPCEALRARRRAAGLPEADDVDLLEIEPPSVIDSVAAAGGKETANVFVEKIKENDHA